MNTIIEVYRLIKNNKDTQENVLVSSETYNKLNKENEIIINRFNMILDEKQWNKYKNRLNNLWSAIDTVLNNYDYNKEKLGEKGVYYYLSTENYDRLEDGKVYITNQLNEVFVVENKIEKIKDMLYKKPLKNMVNEFDKYTDIKNKPLLDVLKTFLEDYVIEKNINKNKEKDLDIDI